MRKNRHQHLFIASILVGLSGCGRKPRDFFQFEQPESNAPAISKLSFNAPRNGKAIADGSTVKLSWSSVTTAKGATLAGYNIYRFYKNGFISKTPINRKPIKTTAALYHKKPGELPAYFVIRALFILPNQEKLEGPTSKVIMEQLP
jgi:hypothetical protein